MVEKAEAVTMDGSVFLDSFMGEENWNKWTALRDQLNFKSNKQFITWMLSTVESTITFLRMVSEGKQAVLLGSNPVNGECGASLNGLSPGTNAIPLAAGIGLHGECHDLMLPKLKEQQQRFSESESLTISKSEECEDPLSSFGFKSDRFRQINQSKIVKSDDDHAEYSSPSTCQAVNSKDVIKVEHGDSDEEATIDLDQDSFSEGGDDYNIDFDDRTMDLDNALLDSSTLTNHSCFMDESNSFPSCHSGVQEQPTDTSTNPPERRSSNSLKGLCIEADDSYYCSLCNKKFKTKSNLREHVNVRHFGRSKFTCELCGKLFRRQGHLKEHMYLHTGEDKPFKCQLCDRSFLRRGMLDSHYVGTHGITSLSHIKDDEECEKSPHNNNNSTSLNILSQKMDLSVQAASTSD